MDKEFDSLNIKRFKNRKINIEEILNLNHKIIIKKIMKKFYVVSFK